ncbi:hypothetical protein [Flavobacterium sp. HJSW_4]|uniref:hypothetical protein n=1 Tax=Flavobacterium sp. HJSW_4 TaxID=3344660 RepID=UPI0035F338D8
MLLIILAVLGAVANTSIQVMGKTVPATVIGYIQTPDGKCLDVPVKCSDNLSPFLCRLNVTSGPIAYQKDIDYTCIIPLYRFE